MARISNVWVSPGKNSGRMDTHETVRAVAGHGLEGCAHARPGTKREVLFASREHLDAVGVEPGRIRENFTVEGDDVHTWPVGQLVRAGSALFEITMVCDPCERMDAIRPGLRAELEGRRGMLARVVETGNVSAGDEIELL
jgi:MOSC domain-containing protein YiiM